MTQSSDQGTWMNKNKSRPKPRHIIHTKQAHIQAPNTHPHTLHLLSLAQGFIPFFNALKRSGYHKLTWWNNEMMYEYLKLSDSPHYPRCFQTQVCFSVVLFAQRWGGITADI